MFYAAPHKTAPQEGGFYFMKIKISNAITAALCAAVLSAASYSLGYADADTGGGTGYSSQGKIVFDNGTEDTADDVIFDASDFRLIDDMVTEGKTNIKNELNQYGNIQIDDDIPEFGTLAASVSAISDGTDAAAHRDREHGRPQRDKHLHEPDQGKRDNRGDHHTRRLL